MDITTTLATNDKRESPSVKYFRFDIMGNTIPDSANTGIQVKRTVTINELPEEMLMKIFSYLNTEDLLDSVRHTSPYWNSLVKSSPVWKNQIFSILKSNTIGVDASQHSAKTICESISTFEHVPYIKHIEATGLTTDETKALLKSICKHWVDVRSVDIAKCSIRDPSLLEQLFLKSPNIEEFSASLSMEIAQFCINSLKLCENFTCLTLLGIDEKGDSVLDFTPIAEGCPKLKHMKVGYSVYDPDSLVHLLKQKCSKIKTLIFSSDSLRDDTILPFKNCTSLTIIHCGTKNCRFSRNLLECICSAPRLKSLVLFQLQDMCVTMMKEYFRDCSVPHLEELIISACILCPKSRDIWKSSLSRIDNLPISWRYTNNNWKGKEMFTLQNLNYMKLVDLDSFSDERVEELAQCIDIEELNVVNCNTLCDENFATIIRRMKLKFLGIANCQELTDNVLQCIAKKSGSLKVICLSRCKFSGAGMLNMFSEMHIDIIHILNCSNVTQKHVKEMRKKVNRVEYY